MSTKQNGTGTWEWSSESQSWWCCSGTSKESPGFQRPQSEAIAAFDRMKCVHGKHPADLRFNASFQEGERITRAEAFYSDTYDRWYWDLCFTSERADALQRKIAQEWANGLFNEVRGTLLLTSVLAKERDKE